MRRGAFVGLICAGLAVSPGAGEPARAETPQEQLAKIVTLMNDARANFQPLPVVPPIKDMPNGAARLDLGRRLFFENRVSADGAVSCSHCHQPERHGADGLEKSVGFEGATNARNAPTVFNAALNSKQHWRGDRESLEEQAEKSLLGPATFGNPDYETAMNRLKAVPGYVQAFAKAFPFDKEPVNSKNWGAAIGAFERTLLTPSKFDHFLDGDFTALNETEQAGLRKFVDLGCAGCHGGPGLGGAELKKFGLRGDYWKETGVAEPDRGRAEVTKDDFDLYVFKVPSLRNVAKTTPYFHDGSVAALDRAVKVMGKVQLGADIADADAAAIVAFLGTLSGEAPANFSAPEPYPDAPAEKAASTP
jgi:cytochrome c peroxidase